MRTRRAVRRGPSRPHMLTTTALKPKRAHTHIHTYVKTDNIISRFIQVFNDTQFSNMFAHGVKYELGPFPQCKFQKDLQTKDYKSHESVPVPMLHNIMQ